MHLTALTHTSAFKKTLKKGVKGVRHFLMRWTQRGIAGVPPFKWCFVITGISENKFRKPETNEKTGLYDQKKKNALEQSR